MKTLLSIIALLSVTTIQQMCAAQSSPLDNWHQRYLPFQDGCANQIAYGNGAFVAMGYNDVATQVFTSQGGEVWHQQFLPVDFDLSQLDYFNGLFFASVSSLSESALLTSSDGVIWTNHVGLTPQKLAYGNAVFVGTTYNALLISSNGINWTATVTNSSFSPQDIAFGNGLFIILGINWSGRRGVILTSPDGRGWTYRRNHYGEEPETVVCGNDRFLVQGDFGSSTNGVFTNLLTSTNGVEWTPVVGPAHLDFNGRSLSFQNGVFLSGGRNNTNAFDSPLVLSSLDGVAWSEHNVGTNFFDESIDAFAYGNGTLVAVGSCLVLQSEPLTNGPPAEAPSLGIKSLPGLTVTGTVGKTYSIDYTTDANGTSGWQTITNLLLLTSPTVWVDLEALAQSLSAEVLLTSPTVWVDLEATNSARRFYRAVAKWPDIR